MMEFTNTQIAQVIDEYIHKARDRAVLKSRFIDGLTYEELSWRYDISVVQAKRIVYKHELTLFDHLGLK